ncbi:hypothetical protein D3C80_1686380 [compost metagenome]
MAEFGTTTILLSPEVRVVVNSWTDCTTPLVPATSMNSPALMGRKMISRKPAAKLESEPCSARPMARPAAPIMATKEAVCTPTRPRAAITTNTRMVYLRMLPTKWVTVVSSLRVCITLTTALLMRLAAM